VKEKLFYDDYYKQKNVTYERGKYNIVRTPCGSGKTYHCMNVITNPYNDEYGLRYGLCRHFRCLYVTDTSALRESIIESYKKHTGKSELDKHNLEVINYFQFGTRIEKYGLDTICDRYDYIFLDEIHQLFVYEDKFGSDDDHYYKLGIESLEDIVRSNTTLICLSATPKLLFDFIHEIHDERRINDIVPIGDLHKIKCYTNDYEIPVHDVSNAIDEINLEHGDKVFIFAHRIYELEQLAELCEKRGWTVTTLWRIKHNAKFRYLSKILDDDTLTDEEREELKNELEKCQPMSPFQLEQRKKLIETGEFDTDVIILNSAYESGINIENGKDSQQRTIHVVVSSTVDHEITQARGRIRHNIDCLWHLTNDFHDCDTGIDAHKNLVSRLEQLAEECRQDEFTFTGKQGKQRISSILMLYTLYTYKGKTSRKRVKNVEPMNNVLMLYELPFHIEEHKGNKRINGKRVTSWYVVIDERVE
jgi:hypothetical protein